MIYYALKENELREVEQMPPKKPSPTELYIRCIDSENNFEELMEAYMDDYRILTAAYDMSASFRPKIELLNWTVEKGSILTEEDFTIDFQFTSNFGETWHSVSEAEFDRYNRGRSSTRRVAIKKEQKDVTDINVGDIQEQSHAEPEKERGITIVSGPINLDDLEDDEGQQAIEILKDALEKKSADLSQLWKLMYEKHAYVLELQTKIIELEGNRSVEVEETWTDVNNRLPEEGGRYWVYVEEVNDLGIGHYQWNADYHSVEKRWNIIGGRVTHWRNLMPPPQQLSNH